MPQGYDLDNFPIGHSMEEIPKEDIFNPHKDLSYREMLDDRNFSLKRWSETYYKLVNSSINYSVLVWSSE